MAHTHYKWDCPKSNGRHEWEWDLDKIDEINLVEMLKTNEPDEIGFPIKCIHGCGAFGTEWYVFKEIIEGE